MATGETLRMPKAAAPTAAVAAKSPTGAAAAAAATATTQKRQLRLRPVSRFNSFSGGRTAGGSGGGGSGGGGGSRRCLSRSHSLTVADWAGRWKEAFGMFDRDKDGIVRAEELAMELQRLGVDASRAEVDRLLSHWDKDGKGALSLLDFTSLMNSPRFCGVGGACRLKPSSGEGSHDTEELLELKAAFEIFDRDGDGALNPQEVRAALELLGEDAGDEDVALVMSEADTNCNGSLSFKEFCEVLGSGGGSGLALNFPGKSTCCRAPPRT